MLPELGLIAEALETVAVDNRNQICRDLQLFSDPVADTCAHADGIRVVHHFLDVVNAERTVRCRSIFRRPATEFLLTPLALLLFTADA